ncbi:MAG: 4-(cytidine 5'-diphospho)-2-C-methyl-D-erythritol kinase [Ignavibacteria bacterium]|nr:4-(cytidine 5'-diphospho)-2-C-methyl-D-erythritol kinase [Ignavibacteria bacterium]MBK6418584.1 4-(cytidine 5'-diphospho)-2-C-methyl-D-erythritol kinase [Ignavibacteria bacterium]
MNSFVLRACAKINLGLEVLRKRSDGFHDIRSIFIGIDLHDTLEVTASDALEVICEPPVTDLPDENLVSRACRLYSTAFPNEDRAAKITVHKRIPTGGGLGGGSSDAAAALIAMALVNGHDLTDALRHSLKPLAEQLGSDVPFFLHAGVALVEGRGEHITPLDLSIPWTVLLVCPGLHVNTAHAYSTLGITSGKPGSDLVDKLRMSINNQQLMQDHFVNDFERSVFVQHPVLADIKRTLIDNQAIYASMSGSGSTMFGLYTSVENAEQAQTAFPTMDTYICHPVYAPFLSP